jgi:hypothetical protein
MKTIFRTMHSMIHFDHATGKMVVLDGLFRVPMPFQTFWQIVKLRRSQCRRLGIDYEIRQDQQ